MSLRYPFPDAWSGVRIWTLLCVIVAGGCAAEAREDSVSAKAPKPATDAKQAPPSSSAPNEPVKGEALELSGDLRPEQAADLSFKIGGQLSTVKVRRGDRVQRGDLLATLSDAEARAQLAQAEAAISQADAQLALARDNEARASTLVAMNAAPGSQATAVRLQTASANAALMQARAARDLAAASLGNHQLRAPFDGEIVRVPDGVGQIVAPAISLFRLEALKRLVLRATISESDVDRVHVGDPVVIETNNGRKVTGKVQLVLRSLEAASRRAPVEVSVPNKDFVLIAGSYVRATHTGR